MDPWIGRGIELDAARHRGRRRGGRDAGQPARLPLGVRPAESAYSSPSTSPRRFLTAAWILRSAGLAVQPHLADRIGAGDHAAAALGGEHGDRQQHGRGRPWVQLERLDRRRRHRDLQEHVLLGQALVDLRAPDLGDDREALGLERLSRRARAARGASERPTANWHNLAKDVSSCDYGFHMAITEWNDEIKDELKIMCEQGITSFKAYMAYDNLRLNDGEIYEILKCLKKYNGLLCVHCENGDLVNTMIKEQLRCGNA